MTTALLAGDVRGVWNVIHELCLKGPSPKRGVICMLMPDLHVTSEWPPTMVLISVDLPS